MRALRSRKLFCIILFGLGVYPLFTSAHLLNYVAVKTTLTPDADVLHFVTDISVLFNDNAANKKEQLALYQNYYQNNFSITDEGRPCPVTVEDFSLNTKIPQTEIHGRFNCTKPIVYPGDIEVRAPIFADKFAIFDHYISFVDKEIHADIVLNSGHTDTKFIGKTKAAVAYAATHRDEILAANTPESLLTILKQFLLLGITHILTGLDHILFLVAVVLIVPSLRKIFIIITSFTLAHSMTLILAGLHVVVLSPRIVEPLIALSIIYMALDDIRLLRRLHPVSDFAPRFLGAFGFGLVHGLGFAGALTEMRVPGEYVLPALITFNIGIEFGQMMILALVLPLLKFFECFSWHRKFLVYCASIIAVVALFWFCQRIFFIH